MELIINSNFSIISKWKLDCLCDNKNLYENLNSINLLSSSNIPDDR